MQKLRLNLTDLVVETFEVVIPPEQRGTVGAYSGNLQPETCDTADPYACNTVPLTNCNSCSPTHCIVNTCFHTCPVSCNGSCDYREGCTFDTRCLLTQCGVC